MEIENRFTTVSGEIKRWVGFIVSFRMGFIVSLTKQTITIFFQLIAHNRFFRLLEYQKLGLKLLKNYPSIIILVII